MGDEPRLDTDDLTGQFGWVGVVEERLKLGCLPRVMMPESRTRWVVALLRNSFDLETEEIEFDFLLRAPR